MKPEELDFLISELSNQTSQLNHEDLTLLLELMKKIPRFRKYNNNQEIFRFLMKRLNMIKSMKLDGHYLFRLLFALDDMKFPNLIFIKSVNYIINEYFDSDTITAGSMDRQMEPIDSLRIFLLLLEKK